jgi:hypothetical protein
MCRTASAEHLRRASLVPVMETTDFRDRNDRPSGYARDRSLIWRVFLEAKVCSTPMIIQAVDRQDAPQMRLVENDHVIETFSSD